MADACTGVYINPTDDGGNGGDNGGSGGEDSSIGDKIRENAIPIAAGIGLGAVAYTKMGDD